jgi:methionyl-tRNA formyltransferase
MRLIFAGTPDFAAVALKALVQAGHEIVLVLTQPDRPAGRGMKLTPSPVKQLALEHGLSVFQPATLKNPDAQQTITDARADVMVVAAYGLILPQVILDTPKHGCLNIHASLLPRWRGAAPILRAIEAGDGETGITIMQMDAGLDTGAMLLMCKKPIAVDDTTGTLHDKLAALGAECIVDALTQLESGQLTPIAQPAEGVTYAHKISKAEAHIDWQQPAAAIERKIRAFNPYPVAFSLLNGEPLRIWRATAREGLKTLSPGTIKTINNQLVIVECGVGELLLDEVQKPGGKRISSAQFLQSHSLQSVNKFDAA